MEELEALLSEISDPIQLLTPDQGISANAKKLLSRISQELKIPLLTEGFDEEQIWGQIQLYVTFTQDSKILPELKQTLEDAQLEISDQDSEQNSEQDSEQYSDSQQSDEELEDQEQEQDRDEDLEEDENLSTGELEDDFFKLDDLEQFVREGEMDKEDPGIDESDLEDDEETTEQNAKFDDFFINPKEQESEEEQEKIFTKGGLDQYMDRLEDKMVGNKPWQLKGEVQSRGRPVNSLLDQYLDFEVATNPAPLTQTPVVTNEIEDVIKQRILDLNFDDVRPRLITSESRAKTSAEDFMDYEKSKKSLAELYEEDYKKQVLHLPINTEKEKAKKDATALFRKLCYNLDLLSNLQPTPKPKVIDIEIKSSNVPALVLEEKLPFSVSLEQTKTAREVFDPKETSLKAEEELTKSDRNTIRKRHKTAMRTRKKEKMHKLIDKMARDPRNGKFEFRKVMKEEKAKKELLERKKQPHTKFSRSSEFFKNFQKLNKEVKAEKEKLEKKSNKKLKV